MCGLIFLYQEGALQAELGQKADMALAHIAHRGPDNQGLIIKQPWLVGHRRLAILDLQTSRQPMMDPSRRYILAYNGEVYNFLELRKKLQNQWNFQTHGDTEVVLAGLVLNGEKFLEAMEGMFALALWDQETRTLLLARDRMGKKPLYYQNTKDGMACCSELPGLAKLCLSPFVENLDSTADYLRYGYYLPGTTAYDRVSEALPGHFLKWRPGEKIIQKSYWRLPIGGFSGTHLEARNTLRETLIESVRKRLVADVEVGSFLSGGIDSSLIVAILAEEIGVHPKTFSMGFEEKSFDERRFARTVAQKYRTHHFEECLNSWDRTYLINLLLKHIGQPFYDASLLPTALISKLAAEHVKVVLSGDGGDELFSGYQRYQARVLLRWYTRLPVPLRKNIESLINRLPEPMAHHSRSILKKAHLFLDIVNRQKDETPYIAPLLYSGHEFALLAPDLVNRGHPAPCLSNSGEPDSLMEMMAADALVYLPQDVLVKVDRASMAHSLEVRTPFLDQKVVELAFSLPRGYHRRGFSGKRMLKETFHDLLPSSIWRRRKQGFGVPLHHWFRGPLAAEMLAMLDNIDSPVNQQYTKQLLKLHQDGKRDNGYRLWNIYVYLLFRQHIVNGMA